MSATAPTMSSTFDVPDVPDVPDGPGPIDGDLTAVIHQRMPFSALLAVEVVTATTSEVVLRGRWDAAVCTDAGMLHGGYLMALADSAGAVCAALNMPVSSRTVTVGSTTNFFRAVRSGDVVARCRAAAHRRQHDRRRDRPAPQRRPPRGSHDANAGGDRRPAPPSAPPEH